MGVLSSSSTYRHTHWAVAGGRKRLGSWEDWHPPPPSLRHLHPCPVLALPCSIHTGHMKQGEDVCAEAKAARLSYVGQHPFPSFKDMRTNVKQSHNQFIRWVG